MISGFRSTAAAAVTRVVNSLARRLGSGAGTVAGGSIGLRLDPHLLERLGAGRRTVLVTGTNGKTTTTRLLVAALEPASGGPGSVATNATGSNMPAGHVAALAAGHPGAPAVLEVDEGYLAEALVALDPEVAVLLNLSRDQLDRTSEVRMLSGRWRSALGAAQGTLVVANADDPLVTWAAGGSPRVVWVAAGLGWRSDAVGCPACDGRIRFERAPGDGWWCRCGYARPTVEVSVAHDAGGGTWAVWSDGRRLPVELAIPGSFNAANAVMAAVAAGVMGIDVGSALETMGELESVGGRFSVNVIDGVPTRLLLAKNPAGWHELLDLVGGESRAVVVAINSRVADGRDPSWLWDVDFERLRGRRVVASGERCLDLAVRLRYAEVPHLTVREPVAAVTAAAGGSKAPVDFIGNYTAFAELLGRT
ncbi:MAG: DUF1727 domain-containing protein [Acidimicrobiales bacterium]